MDFFLDCGYQCFQLAQIDIGTFCNFHFWVFVYMIRFLNFVSMHGWAQDPQFSILIATVGAYGLRHEGLACKFKTVMQVHTDEWNVRVINDEFKRVEVADTFSTSNLDRFVRDRVGG